MNSVVISLCPVGFPAFNFLTLWEISLFHLHHLRRQTFKTSPHQYKICFAEKEKRYRRKDVLVKSTYSSLCSILSHMTATELYYHCQLSKKGNLLLSHLKDNEKRTFQHIEKYKFFNFSRLVPTIYTHNLKSMKNAIFHVTFPRKIFFCHFFLFHSSYFLFMLQRLKNDN